MEAVNCISAICNFSCAGFARSAARASDSCLSAASRATGSIASLLKKNIASPTDLKPAAAATAFFKQAIDNSGLPSKVVIDKSGANNAGLENIINSLFFLAGLYCFIDILKVKYLNNSVEQDHRFIKRITKPMMGFKAFHSARATLAGIETARMIRKGQFTNNLLPAHQQFMALAVSDNRLIYTSLMFATEPLLVIHGR